MKTLFIVAAVLFSFVNSFVNAEAQTRIYTTKTSRVDPTAAKKKGVSINVGMIGVGNVKGSSNKKLVWLLKIDTQGTQSPCSGQSTKTKNPKMCDTYVVYFKLTNTGLKGAMGNPDCEGSANLIRKPGAKTASITLSGKTITILDIDALLNGQSVEILYNTSNPKEKVTLSYNESKSKVANGETGVQKLFKKKKKGDSDDTDDESDEDETDVKSTDTKSTEVKPADPKAAPAKKNSN